MNLSQTGSYEEGYIHVSGSYGHDNGELSGTVDGNTLTGTWIETGNDTGRFQFTMSSDGESFNGKWGRKDGPLEHDWTGRREYERRQ